MGLENLSAKYLEKYLSFGPTTKLADIGWFVDYLMILFQKHMKIFLGQLVFENLGNVNLSARYFEKYLN